MSDYCLSCHSGLIPEVSWSIFFTKTVPTYLCSSCENQLTLVGGPTCKICDRPLEKLDPQYVIGATCYDCVRWEEDPEWQSALLKNHSIYVYNDFLKEVISQYKFRGDYIIAKAFSENIRKKIKTIDYDILVPIPLSKERQYERGFNQSEGLIVEAGFQPTNFLQRIHSEKQSKKSRHDRIHVQQVFRCIGSDLSDKRILLIDDIYTTGSTLRHAAKLLKEEGAQSVSSLTLARG
ncbi:ComF family protein [Bacillus dakarensis]|uniref:ComF family protein n=1 Tax=Robertmurraya dakarensis TaxID=1926278 RepID=UPI000981B5FF|nr:ComF family protein [Bacillus dakarensis]